MARKETSFIQEFSDRIIEDAIRRNATDIHIDPEEKTVRIRFRISGVLETIDESPIALHPQIIGRIKALSNMDFVERRLPQSGHLQVPYGDRVYNLRISTFPTAFGEALVIRILNRENTLIPLENLGLLEEQLVKINDLIHRPYGILLVTGPTNSGKTVLLYAMLNKLNRKEQNIVTVEDPIELEIENMRQAQINDKIGFTFHVAMRSILRQDPDVVMLGEIRDAETIQMAAQAALSGRLVIATFHTFDVPALIIRLTEMGIPNSILGHAFLGVVSTRLVRLICSACRAPYEPNEFEKSVAKKYGIRELYHGKGCAKCGKTGYTDRVRIAEVVTFTNEIQTHILERRGIQELRELIKKTQGPSLWDVALLRVKNGETTLAEAIRSVGLPSL